MKYIVTSTIDQQFFIDTIKAVDPNATIIVHMSDVEKLIDYIQTHRDEFDKGFITASNIDTLIKHNVKVGLEVTEQVRINGADIYPSSSIYGLLSEDVIEDVTDAWYDHVCGDMLDSITDLLMIALFGLSPDQTVIDAFKSGLLKCEHFNMETQQQIFSDYPQFVNDLLNQKNFNGAIEVDIGEGYDN